MMHLISCCDNYTTKEVAGMVFCGDLQAPWLLCAIVSDQDVPFTSTFWTHLYELMGVELHMLGAYHPE